MVAATWRFLTGTFGKMTSSSPSRTSTELCSVLQTALHHLSVAAPDQELALISPIRVTTHSGHVVLRVVSWERTPVLAGP